MRKLSMFNMITLDGYFEGPGHDISWHTVDHEFNEFAIEQLNSVDTMIFGRVTYDLMASYWPTPEALKDDASVAELMNTSQKIVCSRTMEKATWSNTRLINREIESEIKKLKMAPGKELIIFGSAVLCASLSKAGLIDEYRIMISPQTLGAGTPLFRDRLSLDLKSNRKFSNGNLLLTYTPASRA